MIATTRLRRGIVDSPVRWRRPARMATVSLVLPLALAALPSTVSSRSSPVRRATVTASARFVAVRAVPDRTLEAAARVMRLRLRDLATSGKVVVADGSLDVSVQDSTRRAAATVLQVLGSSGQLWIRPVLCGAPSYDRPTRGTAPPHGRLPACPSAYRYSARYWDNSNGNSQYSPGHADYAPLARFPSTSSLYDLSHPNRPVLLSSGLGGLAPRYLLGPAAASSAIVQRAQAKRTDFGGWLVVIAFTRSGGRLFNRIAASHFHELLANDVDGIVVSAPLILSRSFNGAAQLSGFTKASAWALASELSSGPLPVSLRMVSATSVKQRA